MTSIAFIIAVIPLVFASGAGQAARHSLGTVVFGGMLISTFLNLAITPVLYVIIKSLEGGRGPVETAKRSGRAHRRSEPPLARPVAKRGLQGNRNKQLGLGYRGDSLFRSLTAAISRDLKLHEPSSFNSDRYFNIIYDPGVTACSKFPPHRRDVRCVRRCACRSTGKRRRDRRRLREYGRSRSERRDQERAGSRPKKARSHSPSGRGRSARYGGAGAPGEPTAGGPEHRIPDRHRV